MAKVSNKNAQPVFVISDPQGEIKISADELLQAMRNAKNTGITEAMLIITGMLDIKQSKGVDREYALIEVLKKLNEARNEVTEI